KYSTHNVGQVPFSFAIPSGTNPQICCATASAAMTYLTMPMLADLTSASQLVVTFHLQSSGTPIFGVNLFPDNQTSNCYAPPIGQGYPALLVPLLWRTGPVDNQF